MYGSKKIILQEFVYAQKALCKERVFNPISLIRHVNAAGGAAKIGIDPKEFQQVINELCVQVLPTLMRELYKSSFTEVVEDRRYAIAHVINFIGGAEEAIKLGALTPSDRDYLQVLGQTAPMYCS